MSENASAVLQLSGVHTHIGAYHILHGVDLDVPEGEVTMLLGRNGALRRDRSAPSSHTLPSLAGSCPLIKLK